MGYDQHVVVPVSTLTAFGTNAAALDFVRIKFPRPVTVNDLIVGMKAGTDATTGGFTVSKSLAGTGSAAAFGTAAITGTSASDRDVSGTVTATAFAAGDVLIVTRTAGTSATLVQPNIGFWQGL